MDNLISVINKLQETFLRSSIPLNIQLPQIVVVGSQSSGKSSILESFVGKDFLPRGKGIVTRRPLVMQLKNINSNKEYAEFSHLPNETFEDFSKVLLEIEKETIRIAGNKKGISSEPIFLKICSSKVIDLTLVDLPGIIKIPVDDQPHDIDVMIRNLILEYISNPQAIILAITPANLDLANSDALKIAKEVDPLYQRTLGVITKLDLMDKGTNTVEIMLNKTFPLKYGYIGVVCRSQMDNQNKKTLIDASRIEKEFFDTHTEYNCVKSCCGIPILSRTLSELLIHHIRSTLPKIKDSITNEIYEKEVELDNLGGKDSILEKNDLLNSFILNLVSQFNKTYKEIIDGKFVKECSKYYIGGARINYIFQDIFKKEINSIDPFDHLSDEDIRTAIKNSNGLNPSLFIPEAAFELLIKQQINRLLNPSLICVKRVFNELKNIINLIEIKEIGRYKKLEAKIKGLLDKVLEQCLEPTNQMIKNIIDIEKSYINTSHPDFLGPELSVLNLFEENNNVQYKNNNIKNFPFSANSSSGNGSSGSGSDSNRAHQNTGNIAHNSSSHNLAGGSGGLFMENLNTNSSFNSNYNNNYNNYNNYNKKEEIKNYGVDDDIKKVVKNNEKNIESSNNSFPNQMRSTNPNSRDLMETCIIKNLISSYYHVVKKNICDFVPKTIMCFLVNQSKILAEKEMVSQLYNSSELQTLLEEDPLIERRRKVCRETLSNLKDSINILMEIKDLKLS